MKIELALCPICLRDFASKATAKVYRNDYMQINKETCCFCQVWLGYDYVIEENKMSSVRLNKSHL